MNDPHVVESQALLLGRVEFGEADLIVHLFTDSAGRISALARGARKSKRRFAGTLEPMHTLGIEYGKAGRSDLHTLKSARLIHPRTGIMSSLQAMEAAGKALKWLRRAAPHQTSEPLLWRSINLLLDGLSEPGGPERALGLLNGFGLRLLEVLGWGLNLDTCVSCGKECPSEQSSWVNPERGGLVCRECGGGPIRLAGAARREMRRATQADQVMIDSAFTRDGLRVVDRALCAHMGPDPAADLGAGLK